MLELLFLASIILAVYKITMPQTRTPTDEEDDDVHLGI